MARNKIVTPSAVADTVRDVDRPFCTTGDVADRLDVTKQAIRNHHDELAGSASLEWGKVGRQRVYWLAERESPPQEVTSTPEPPAGTGDTTDGTEPTEEEPMGIIRRLFTGSDDGMAVPGVALLLLGIVLPLIALRRVLDGAIDRLTAASEVYSTAPEGVRFPRFGSPAGVWLMTFLSGMLGLTAGVGLGILFLDPLPVVAQYAVSAVLALGLSGIGIGAWHYWNTKPAIPNGETA